MKRTLLVHEKECASSVYEDLYTVTEMLTTRIMFHESSLRWPMIEGIVVIHEYEDGPLDVDYCFKEPHGLSVTIKCIAHQL